MLHMGTSSDFWHHTTIGTVIFRLTQHDVGSDSPLVIYNGGRSLITGGFDSQYDHELSLNACVKHLEALAPRL